MFLQPDSWDSIGIPDDAWNASLAAGAVALASLASLAGILSCRIIDYSVGAVAACAESLVPTAGVSAAFAGCD